jgi:GNAT superfamily N-acetyltransferase
MKIFEYHSKFRERVMELDLEALKIISDLADIESIVKMDWQSNILNNQGEIFLLEYNNEIIGVGGYLPKTNKLVELKKLRIDSRFQGQGFGRILLSFIEQKIKSKGYSKIFLDTSKRRPKTLQFYQNNGYMKINERSSNNIELVDYMKSI